jgi:NAD(P)-dependent dehydrogenase (short-subunit alcohol dehydrogenase family)
MARILITGSSDGLGSLAAQALVKRGHRVVLHARNEQRARDAYKACPDAESVLIADLSDLTETKRLADEANRLGEFDCVIHNAGLFRGEYRKTSEGLPSVTAVNSVAPYVLMCLMRRPKRLVFVSSQMHTSGDASLRDWTRRQRGEEGWSDIQGYCDSKLHNILLAFAFARRWKDVESNALDPGWVATKMGGRNASGDIQLAVKTYVMLAEGCGESGKFFKSSKVGSYSNVADDEKLQDKFLQECEKFTGVSIPESVNRSSEAE